MTGVEKIAEVRDLTAHTDQSIRGIARTTGKSRNTIRKIIRSGLTKFTYKKRDVQSCPVTGPIKEIIEDWVKEDMEKKKKHRRKAGRMYNLLIGGYDYTGSYESVARCVREIRKELLIRIAPAYIPLVYYAGDAFQFDWGEMPAYIGKEIKVVYFAVIQLCHSRHFYVRAYPCQKQEMMLDAHRKAFEMFGGCCKRGIYDNLKSAVKKILQGKHRNLQEKFKIFCSHYLYSPEFCNRACGNEKGRVENLIGVIERNFFIPIPHFSSIEELNDCLESFAIMYSKTTEHPEIAGKNRYEVFEEEKKVLVQLPLYGFECYRETIPVVSPCCLVNYDNNRYSAPSDYVGRAVVVKGYAHEVAISYGGNEIARHYRSFERNKYILNPLHYLKVLEKKPGALNDGLPFQDWKLPEVFQRYRELLKCKYDDGDKYFVKVLTLLLNWTVEEVTGAIERAIKLGVYGDGGILAILRKDKELPPTEHLDILIKVELSRYSARQRSLSDYDEILRLGKIEKGVI